MKELRLVLLRSRTSRGLADPEQFLRDIRAGRIIRLLRIGYTVAPAAEVQG
jgi:hypothetical protein